jgi:DivIVA domain-containing protein
MTEDHWSGQQDPEKRIAELERQLAEQKHAAGVAGANPWSQQGADPPPQQAGFPAPPASPSALTTGGWLTPDQVRNMAFSKPPLGGPGYNEAEVDAFLDRVEAALRDPTGHTLTPEQVRSMAFSKPPLGKTGYNQDEVDAFVDSVEEQMKSQHGALPPGPQAGFPPPPIGRLPARPAGSETQLPTRHAADPRPPTLTSRIIGVVFGILLSIVRRAFWVSIAAFIAWLVLLIFVWRVVPGTMWTPLKPLVCGSGQELQTQRVSGYRGDHFKFSCVAPDGTTDDVTRAAWGSIYGLLWVAMWVPVYFYFREGREAEEQEQTPPEPTPAIVTNFAVSAPQPPHLTTDPVEDPVISTVSVNQKPTRCLLTPNRELAMQMPPGRFVKGIDLSTKERKRIRQSSPQPSLALDLGANAVSVMDLTTNALIASAAPAQVTATPETYRGRVYQGAWQSPVLVVDIPGWQPLTITCLDGVDTKRRPIQPRFAWRGTTPERRDKAAAAYMVSAMDWLTLVEKCGLAGHLESS